MMKNFLTHRTIVFLFVLSIMALVPRTSFAQGPSSTRFSGATPEFIFQIPIGALRQITLCETKSRIGKGGQPETYLSCQGIALYIAAVYKWLVGFASILAVLAMTWGGVQWLISRGESGKIQEARKVIGNAFVGLLIALGSYAVLSVINPSLTQFNPLTIQQIKEIPLTIHGADSETILQSRSTPKATPSRSSSGPTSSSATDFPNIKWLDVPKVRSASNEYGEVYADIYERSPVTGEPWYKKGGSQYKSHPNRILDAHEYTHYIDYPVIYVGSGKAFQLKESTVGILDIKKTVPKSFHDSDYDFYFDYFNKYFTGLPVTTVLEELNARNAGMRAGIDMHKRGIASKNFYNPPMPDDPFGEGVAYTMSNTRWIVFALTVATVIEKRDSGYLTREPQFKDALRYLIEDGRTLSRERDKLFTSTGEVEDLKKMQTNADVKALRDLAKRWYTGAWTQQWLGF